MGKSGACVEFILLLINLVFTVMGVVAMAFGFVYFLTSKHNTSEDILHHTIVHHMLLQVDPHTHFYDQILPKAWFIYLVIGIGAALIILSCFGYVGTIFRIRCCLLSYCMFLVAIVTAELGTAAFIFFEHNWKEVMPKDRSGSLDRLYDFVNVNWKVMRWVALGVFILQVIGTFVAVYLRSEYGKSNDVEYLRGSTRPNYRILADTIS